MIKTLNTHGGETLH